MHGELIDNLSEYQMNKVVFIIIAMLCLSPACFGQPWPEIKPISGEVVFVEPAKAIFEIHITDKNLVSLYTLTCQSGDLDDNDFNFSGLFQCRLKSDYSNEYLSSLFVENVPQSADWEGRSRFLLNHVVGQCAAVPDWGAERTFLLRRMRIVLEIHDVELTGNLQSPVVKSFKFAYKIIPDDNAVSAITHKSKISEPWWFASESNCVQEVFSTMKERVK